MSTPPTPTSATFWPLAASAAPPPAVRRFTVDEYHQMIRSGILSELDHVQLVEGLIVEMPPIGPEHSTSTSLVEAAIRAAISTGWVVRTQEPLTLDNSEPEPDIAVVRGKIRDFAQRHPHGTDVALVVEVSESTLVFDRTSKSAAYAAAGIAEYWIVNLIDRQLEVHRAPQGAGSGASYSVRELVQSTGSVALVLDGKQIGQLRVADLLP